jgi:hypothetical protein
MALEPVRTNWKNNIRQGKYFEALNRIYSSITPIGANTMFLRISRRYIPFLALHQFFPTLPIIWTQVAGKGFFAKSKMVSF